MSQAKTNTKYNVSKLEGPLTFLWSVIRPYKYYYLMMAVAPIGSGIFPIMSNYAVKILLDLFSTFEHISFEQAFIPVFWFVMAQVIKDGGWRIHNFAQLKTMPYVFQHMTDRICKHVFNLPYTYFQNNLSGSISGKIRGLNDNYFKMHGALELGLSTPTLTVLFSGIALAFVNLKIFIFTLSFIICYTVLAIKFFTKLSKMEQDKQDSWYYLFGTIADRIQNIGNIFTFAARKHEMQTIQNYYKEIQNPLNIRYYRYDFIISVILSLAYWILVISIFVFVIYLRNVNEITIGDIAFIIAMTFLFSENSWKATMEIKAFLESLSAFRSAFTIMREARCAIDPPNAVDLQVSHGEIVLQDVSFAYDINKLIFDNINLHITPGQKVGLVGHSGVGKSTLIALLLKFFKAQKGNIYIDNQSIYDVSSDSLRSSITLIPQDITLFHRTIGENIGYVKIDATQDEIEHAAKMANIHDFISTLPKQYNTLVGERGIRLSGGQRQRIAIARAILKSSMIIILDEATSSLDSQTENKIQSSINTMLETNKSTVIAIAHRLSTIKHMDRIIVLSNGTIAEDGAFEELLSIPNGKFKELWTHQVDGMI